MPFLDDIPIKVSLEEGKDDSKDEVGCRRFVMDHIKDCEKVLKKLEDANLTFSGEKSAFGQPRVFLVEHFCGAYGQKPPATKVDAIQEMKEECIPRHKCEDSWEHALLIIFGFCTTCMSQSHYMDC